MDAMLAGGVRGIIYQETEFSADERATDSNFDLLIERFERLSEKVSERVSVGISPHATYTVSRGLFEKIADHAINNSVPLAIHAAETKHEDQFLRTGQGFFADHFAKFGVDWDCPRTSPIKFLESTGILAAKPLLVHCVRVDEEDVDIIASTSSTIAHCPKSNAKFGHGYAPLEKFIGANIVVGLGSDSVASNNLCDMIEESRYRFCPRGTVPTAIDFFLPARR